MTIKKYVFILSFMLASCVVNANDPVIDRNTYESYIKESFANSMEDWVFYKMDENYFYIQRKVGFSVKDTFRLKRDDVLVETKENLPTSDFDIKWKDTSAE
jgi:hypothetical protein